MRKRTKQSLVLLSALAIMGSVCGAGGTALKKAFAEESASVNLAPTAHWTFDDANDLGKDSMGNFPLQAYGKPVAGSDETSAYCDFNESSALYYAPVDSRDFTDVFPAFTLTLWAKRDKVQSAHAFLAGSGCAHSSLGFGMGFYSTNNAYILPLGGDGLGGYATNFVTSAADSFGTKATGYNTSLEWNLFSLRVTSSTVIHYGINGYMYEVNGEEAKGAVLENLAQTFTLGGILANGLTSFYNGLDGQIADARLYSTPLTDAQFKAIADAGRGGNVSLTTDKYITAAETLAQVESNGRTAEDVYAAVQNQSVSVTLNDGSKSTASVFWNEVDMSSGTYATVTGVLAASDASNPQSLTVSQKVVFKDNVKLDSIFTDNLVLQRGNARVFGKGGAPGGTVRASYGTVSATGIVPAEGDWVVELPLTQADAEGKELKIEYSSDGTNFSPSVSVQNVRVGEVWFASGQSNMAVTLDYITRKKQTVKYDYTVANNWDKISICQVDYRESSTPLEDIPDSTSWVVPGTVENVSSYSAMASAFASQLQTTLNVPVGIMVSSVGGSCIEEWLDAETMKGLQSTAASMGKVDSRFYNGMVHALKGYGVGGILWYQGEANVTSPTLYKKQFKAYVELYRELFGSDMPVLTMQLPQFETGSAWYEFRNMQWNLQKEIDKAYTVCGIDLGDNTGADDSIHPTDKWPFAERAVGVAAQKVYNLSAEGMPRGKDYGVSPSIVSAKPVKGGILLEADQPLQAKDNKVNGFYVLVGTQYAYPVGQIVDGKIFLECDGLNAKTVFYLQSNTVKADYTIAYGEHGTPLAPFGWLSVTLPDYAVTVTATENGTTTTGEFTRKVGETFTLEIAPNEGYFAEVYVNGEKADYTEGTFSYEIYDNTAIEVKFVSENSEPEQPENPENPKNPENPDKGNGGKKGGCGSTIGTGMCLTALGAAFVALKKRKD